MMIPWRALRETRRVSRVRFRLTPVAFDPDVTFAVMVPVPVHPTSVGVGWFHVGSGNPDVGAAVPAVVAGVPGPIGVLVGWGRNVLDRTCGWADPDDDLGLCNACGKEERAGDSGEDFLHRAIS
jgi:hypothetical protein